MILFHTIVILVSKTNLPVLLSVVIIKCLFVVYSVPSDLRNNMSNSLTDPFSYLGPPLAKSFEFVVSDANETSNIIEALKNKNCKLDCIPVFIYKHLNNFISDTISNLFNSPI